jgi:hypothetical protein
VFFSGGLLLDGLSGGLLSGCRKVGRMGRVVG